MSEQKCAYCRQIWHPLKKSEDYCDAFQKVLREWESEWKREQEREWEREQEREWKREQEREWKREWER